MEINEKSIIGEIVAHNYRYASLFKIFDIDYCCNGNKTIEEAAKEKNLDVSEFVEQLIFSLGISNQDELLFNKWPIDQLAEHIEKKHHRFVEKSISELKPYLEKICKVHGAEHPELFEINSLFNKAAAELTAHMKREELVLFPYIKKMNQSANNGEKIKQAHFGSIENPIEMMKHDHTEEGERFRKIKTLSNGYVAPQDACNTYKVTFALLKEFEDDLHLHIHLENNILFPKAIKMEKELV